jgi:hypothetical protein
LVLFRETLQQSIQANFLDQSLGDRPAQDATTTRRIVEQIRGFKVSLKIVEGARKLVGDQGAGFGTVQTLEFAPDTDRFWLSVLRDLLLDVLDVGLVELWRAPVFEYHEVEVLLIWKTEAG